MVDYISQRIPEYDAVARSTEWNHIFDDSPYAQVQALYQLAASEFAAGHEDIVLRVLALVEEALSSGVQQIVDPFSIEFIETLAGEKGLEYFTFFVSHLGPESQRDFARKR